MKGIINSLEIIKTDKAPKAIGPYSQGIKCSNFVFTSGQIPLNPDTGELVFGDFTLEVLQVLNNLEAVLIASGSSIDKIVKLTVFLTDLSNFQDLNQIFSNYFKNNYPARSVLEVSKLPMNARIEIECVGTL